MSARWRVFAGAAVFAGSTLWSVPTLHHPAWAHALLLFAALVLGPLLLGLVDDGADGAGAVRLLGVAVQLQFPAGLLLVVACNQKPGKLAGLCALPWASLLWLLALLGAWRMARRGWREWALLSRDGGLVYSAVGGAWLMADRLGWRPLGFAEPIVVLTAVHFHYAGWLLPVLTGLAQRELPRSRFAVWTGICVLAGVPAVAVGITASHLGRGPWPEFLAALLMVAGGLGVAGLHLRLVLQGQRPIAVRSLWAVAGISLAAGMVLAALYGTRNFFAPWPWLDLPWMRAIHGTLNACGFGFAGTVAWHIAHVSDGKGIEPRGKNDSLKS